MTRSHRFRAADFIPLAVGTAALIGGTLFGWDAWLVELVVTPPTLVRATLVGAAVVAAIVLFGAAVRRLAGWDDVVSPDWPRMVRAIRLAFLGVAALAAAAGWVLGHPLPIVVALVIAGVDVIETSLLLLVVRSRGG